MLSSCSFTHYISLKLCVIHTLRKFNLVPTATTSQLQVSIILGIIKIIFMKLM